MDTGQATAPDPLNDRGLPGHITYPGFQLPPQRRSKGALVVVLAACLAAVGLFSMRWLSTADAVPGVPRPVDPIDQYLNRKQADPPTLSPEAIIEVLTIADFEPGPGTPPDPFISFIESLPDPPTAEQAREKEFRHAASRLRLGAIITGNNPAAHVNRRTVGIGGVIEVPAGRNREPVRFRVVDIAADGSVTLVAEDPDLDLTVETRLDLRK